MSRQRSPAFSVQLGAYGPEALGVSGISGTEGLSRLFDFRVDFFTVDGEPVAVADLVGKDALVTLSVRDGSPRYVHGQVRGVESLGMKTGRRRYRAHVVPKLWRLTQVHKNGSTMMLVDSRLNNNLTHDGGASLVRDPGY